MDPVEIKFHINDSEVEKQAQSVVDSILRVEKAGGKLTTQLGQEEAAQKSLLQMFNQGTITSDIYAKAQQKLSDIFTKSVHVSDSFSTSAGRLNTSSKLATSGVDNLTKATLRFIATPLGWILAAIVGALVALTSWFNRTEEGQNALRAGTEAFQAVLDQFLKVVDKVGEALYKAFNNPQTAVRNLWKSINENLINRMVGVGDLFKSFGKIISSGFKDGFEDMHNSFLKIGTGVDNFTGKAREFIKETKEAYNKTKELDKLQNQLDKDKRSFLVEEQEMLAKIDEQKRKSPKEAARLEEELAKKKEEFAEKELYLHREKIKISGETNKENLDKEAQLEADLIAIRADGNKRKRDLLEKANKSDRKLYNEARYAREKLHNESIEAENKLNTLLVAAMEDGATKRIAQIEAEYDREIDTIDKKLKEIETLEVKARKDGNFTAVDEENARKAKTDLDVSRGVAATARDEKLKTVNTESAKALQGVWDEIYNNLRSELQREQTEIERSYSERKKIIIENTTEASDREAQLRELEFNKQKTLNISLINDEIKKIDIQKDIELKKQTLVNKTFLFETDKQKALLEIERNAASETLDLYERKAKEGVQGLDDEINQLKADIALMNDELEKMPVRKLNEGLSYLQSFSNAFSGLGGEIGDLFSEIGAQVGNLQTALSDTAKPMDKVSAGISGIVSIINMLSSAQAQRKEKEKEFYQNAIAFAHEYALALNDQLRLQSEINGSGFMTDYAGKINSGFAAMSEATNNYYDSLAKLGDGKVKVDLRNSIDWASVGKGALSGVAAGAAIGSVVPVIGTAIGAVVGGIAGAIAGFFGGKKKKEEYSGLLEVFPELVDGAGNFNKELAQTLINTNQVDENTKQLLQNTIDWADAVETANAQVKEVVVSLAGDLGNNLQKSIVDAWKAGEDASTKMFEVASQSLEGFIEKLLYSTIFSDVFKEFESKLVASLDPRNGDGDILDDYDWLMTQMDQRDNAYITMMEAVKRRAAERGYNMWTDDAEKESAKQKTDTGAFKTVSQESFDLWLGQFTAIRIHISEAYTLMVVMQKERVLMIQSLSNIEKHTKKSAEHLENIDNRLKKMDIEGVKMK